MKLETNIKYYFMCRFKLNDNIEPLINEIESLFEINAETEALHVQLNYWAQQFLLEQDNDPKRSDIFKFDKHNKAGFSKLNFILRETESNDLLKIQFYALCRNQLKVPIHEILKELKCLFEDIAPKRSDLIKWIINSCDQPFPCESFQLDELNLSNHKTLRVELKSTKKTQQNTSKELRKAKENIIDLQDRLALVMASSSSTSSLDSSETSFKKETLNETQPDIPDLINSSENEPHSIEVRKLRRKLNDLEDTNATLNFDLFKQNKTVEQMNLKIQGYELTIQALNDRLVESELKHMRSQSTTDSKYDDLKKEIDSKQADLVKLKTENSNLNHKLKVAEQKIIETELLVDDLKNKCSKEKPVNEEMNNQQAKESLQTLIKQIDELKKENELLKVDKEKARTYANEYVDKLSLFEQKLIKERNEHADINSKQQSEIDELKKQINESNGKINEHSQRYDNLFKLYVGLNESKQRLEQTIEEIHVNQNPKLVEEIITRRQLAKETTEINQLKQSLNESTDQINKLKSDLNDELKSKMNQIESLCNEIDLLKQNDKQYLIKIKDLESRNDTSLKEIFALKEENSNLHETNLKLKEKFQNLEMRLNDDLELNSMNQQMRMSLDKLKELYERFNFDNVSCVKEEIIRERESNNMSFHMDRLCDLFKKYKIKLNDLNYDLDEQRSELTKCKDDIRRWKNINNELTIKNEELNYTLGQMNRKQNESKLERSYSVVFNDVIDLTNEVNVLKSSNKRKLEETTTGEEQCKYPKI